MIFINCAFRDARHLEFLIRKIYRTFNSYCLHVDPRSDVHFHDIVHMMRDCYLERFNVTNIIIVSEIPVVWGTDSILKADLLCIKHLYDKFPEWTALVNIAGSEFPIRKNLAFVKKFLRSRNTIEKGVSLERKEMTFGMYKHRFKYYWKSRKNKIKRKRRPRPPFNLSLYKGQRSGILDRTWVWFLLYHPVSITFYDWCLDSGHTEEHFLHTLTMIDKIDWSEKKGYIVKQRHSYISNPIVRATWTWHNITCHGQWRNNVCVYSSEDVPHILDVLEDGPIMANKFQSSVDPIVIPCLEDFLNK